MPIDKRAAIERGIILAPSAKVIVTAAQRAEMHAYRDAEMQAFDQLPWHIRQAVRKAQNAGVFICCQILLYGLTNDEFTEENTMKVILMAVVHHQQQKLSKLN
jgi:hypothetical protein